MGREPILLKKISRANPKGKVVIGIAGTHSGAGVTHLGILLANYVSEWLGLKTAFLECSHQDEFQFIQECFYGTEEEHSDNVFHLHRVTFYKSMNAQKIPEIAGDRYECIILDLGTDLVKNRNEFLRCDKKIVVSSLALWKKHKLEQFIRSHEPIKNNEQWIYAIPFSTKKILKRTAKEMYRTMYDVPFEPDPFLLSPETVRFFRKII